MNAGTIGRWMGAGVVVLGLVLGGCNKVNRGEFNAALDENDQLRQQNSELQTQLGELNTRNASLEQENRDLNSRFDQSGRQGSITTGGYSPVSGADRFGPGTNVSQRGSDLVVAVAGDVLFDSGKATLKSTSKKTLDSIAASLASQYSANEIRIEGYTDSDPIRKSNWKTNERLSSERALAVEEYLSTKGVDKSRMYSAGFGSASPKGTKKDSRRVEIVILGGGN
jgi:chemotaxis protein MotB